MVATMSECQNWLTAFAVLTDGCNGLCNPLETIPQIHQDSACTKADVAALPMLRTQFVLASVHCIKLDAIGNVDKSACFV